MQQKENYFNLMYGFDNESQKTPAKTYQKLSGLKLSGNHQYIIEYEGKVLYLANSSYVYLLEKRIQELNNEISSLKNYIKKLASAHNRAIENIESLSRELESIKNNSVF